MVHRCIVIVAGLSMRITVLLTLCVALLAVGTVQVRAGDTSDVLLLDVVLRPSGTADVIKTPMVGVQFIPGTHSVALPMVISTERYSATNRAFELEALRLINVERVNAGVAPLTESAALTQAARRHASDLAAHDILSHVGTDGSRVWDRARDAGATYAWGEAVCSGSLSDQPADIIARFMNSPPHRTGLLDPQATTLGMGYAVNTANAVYPVRFVFVTGH